MSPQSHVWDTILYLETAHLIKPSIAIQHLIKSRNELFFHENTQLQSTQFSVIDNLRHLQKKRIIISQSKQPCILKNYVFLPFFQSILRSSFQSSRPANSSHRQVDASLFTGTFQHHTPAFWYKTIPKKECGNQPAQNTTGILPLRYYTTINYF